VSEPDRKTSADLIPPPTELRERLSSAIREVRVLRRLLRLSAQLAEGRRPACRQEVARAG
jgi:hypothetical protein